MKSSYVSWLAVLALSATPAFSAGTATTTRETTIKTPDGKTVTYTGTVTEYVPQKTIVLRHADDKLVTYTLNADLVIPEDVQVGKSVTILAEPVGNSTVVRKVTTTSLTPEGDVKTTTRTTETAADGSTKLTEETTVEGTVSAYQASKLVTVKRVDGSTMTYVLDGTATVPADLTVGKRVVLRVAPSGQQTVVRKITYYTTTN